jgi:hypothetical protein
MKITETEKRILQNLHLYGYMGKCGSLTQKQRLTALNGLIAKGLLSSSGKITKLGIEISAPSYTK